MQASSRARISLSDMRSKQTYRQPITSYARTSHQMKYLSSYVVLFDRKLSSEAPNLAPLLLIRNHPMASLAAAMLLAALFLAATLASHRT